MRMWRYFGGDPSGPAVVGPYSEETDYPWVQGRTNEKVARDYLSSQTSAA